jgi:hypothetical protein
VKHLRKSKHKSLRDLTAEQGAELERRRLGSPAELLVLTKPARDGVQAQVDLEDEFFGGFKPDAPVHSTDGREGDFDCSAGEEPVVAGRRQIRYRRRSH